MTASGTSMWRIALQDIDAAGVVFGPIFAEQAHRLYEQTMANIGHPLPQMIHDSTWALPLVASTSLFKRPCFHGDLLTLTIGFHSLDDSSFRSETLFRKEDTLVAEVTFDHCAIDLSTRKRCVLPKKLLQDLSLTPEIDT